ncbi:hypothetical protein AMS68_005007 [Peltaster fructicola]|uniref:Cyclic nucleotide-binding domain-containing protein n=1 Tax=Peltaster fructicola TaxID=286661 RepID=A0A6H0XYJ6_9PEZI|nr:hypothetical protein AMS68_005007 [Peltaster fructicola]
MRRQQFRSSQTALRNSSDLTDPSQLIHSFDYGINPSRPAKSSPLGSSAIAGLPLELLERLKAFPLFLSAPESFLLHIGRSLRPSIFQPSQEIIREGEDAKAMYWLVRGNVKVTSRDGESTYAELKPGAFFGEIGILMDMPRTASIVATVKSLVVRLNKEDLRKELPNYPDVEKAIREEALERLAILERKKEESITGPGTVKTSIAARKRSRDWAPGDIEMGEAGAFMNGEVLSNKRRKSPSPGIAELAASSALGTEPPLTVRGLLKELPLFAGLPSDILHYLGVNAQPVTFAPFVEILKQGSTGRDVYFIIKGEVEILTQAMEYAPSTHGRQPDNTRLRFRARLKAGQYFGEVTSLSLSPRRTATVRSVDTVECLLIKGEVLDDLWRRCSPTLKQQVESEAKRRLDAAKLDDDVDMQDAKVGGVDEADEVHWRASLPTVKFDNNLTESLTLQLPKMEPIDPDPFFNPDLDNMRAKSRRSSLAPPTPLSEGQQSPDGEIGRTPSPPAVRFQAPSPLRPKELSSSISPSQFPSPISARRPSLVRIASDVGKGRLPDSLLVHICQYLDLLDLMRLRLVSMHWHNLLSTSPDILHDLNLSHYNRRVTDTALRDSIVPFVGSRPKRIDLSNCFHITDEGFKTLAESCGNSITMWKMKSVWDVSGPAVLSMIDKAKSLEEIDLSNCRKVGDNLLARVVGWVVPEHKTQPQAPTPSTKRPPLNRNSTPASPAQPPQPPPAPGTIIGAAKLKRLTLSYCKHIQDRSMAHIAMHASERLESLDLTRCTSISDAGFHSWGIYNFKNMRRLVLADCTYLTDQAIVGIVGGCRGLQELDLSFCCALSDTATEVLALGLPALRRLNMAFCGSAVSDNSMRCLGLHLLELRYLSVRGCVRVTGQGVESVVEGCAHLEEFDVSQCKNLRPWLQRGGVRIVNDPSPRGLGRSITFDTVAGGT